MTKDASVTKDLCDSALTDADKQNLADSFTEKSPPVAPPLLEAKKPVPGSDTTVSTLSVNDARRIANELHGNQKDKLGRPYGEHLEAVRLGVKVLGGDREQQIAALFHDVLEDTKATRKDLLALGVSERAVKAVEAVTKPLSAVQNTYLEDIIKAGEDAIIVKIADLLHNLRKDRLADLKKKSGAYIVERLQKKYRPSLARLLMEFNLIIDEDEQKKLATKPVGSGGGTVYSGYGAKGQSFKVKSLIIGDWPTTWKAPILRIWEASPTSVGFMLANGQIRTEPVKYGNSANSVERSIYVYPQNTWETDLTIKFSDVSEDDIEDFLALITKAKASSSTAPAIVKASKKAGKKGKKS